MKVGGFTKGAKGYVVWYKGRTRHIASPGADPSLLSELWVEKKRAIDQEERDVAVRTRIGGMTLRELLSAFFAAMKKRVESGKPKPLSERMLHNYDLDLNEFGKLIGGATPIEDVGPEQFAAYAQKFSKLANATYDSKVAHVATLFNWAVRMEYLDRVRFGGEFARPAKSEIRHDRIARVRSFTAPEVRKLLGSAKGTMRCMIMLGICGGLINSEVANLTRECVDLDAGIIDFRRRKTGRVRRVVPLPPPVVKALRDYQRPSPAEPKYADFFFLTEKVGRENRRGRTMPAGLPYARMRGKGPSNTISQLFARLSRDAGVRKAGDKGDGRNFAALRTTLTNLAPRGSREDVEVLIGHAKGTILLDHYLEAVDFKPLRRVVNHVWKQVST